MFREILAQQEMDDLLNAINGNNGGATTATKERINETIETIETMLELAHIARREGLHTLEEVVVDFAESRENNLIKLGISLIVEGSDINFVNKIFDNLAYAWKLDGVELVMHKIITRGIAMIYEGVNPRLVEQVLWSYAGKIKM